MGRKWECSCGKKFRNEYLLYRHTDVENKRICPICFMPLRLISGNDSEQKLYCPACRFMETFTSKETFAQFKSRAIDRHYEVQVDRENSSSTHKTPVAPQGKAKP